MPENKRRSRSSTAEQRATEARRSAESDVGLLDNPDVADEPSEIRHALYFAGVLGTGIFVNLLAMLIVSGGR